MLRVLALAAALTASSSYASTVPVTNAGFEDFILAEFDFSEPLSAPTGFPNAVQSADPIPGWVLSDPNGSIGTFNPIVDDYSIEAFEGDNVAYANNGGQFSQTLSEQLLPLTRYELKVQIGHRAFPTVQFGGYTVELLAGTSVLSIDDNSIAVARGTYEQSIITFETGASDSLLGEPLGIRLTALGNASQTNFDDVELTAVAVPEPQSLVLLVTSLVLLKRRLRS